MKATIMLPSGNVCAKNWQPIVSPLRLKKSLSTCSPELTQIRCPMLARFASRGSAAWSVGDEHQAVTTMKTGTRMFCFQVLEVLADLELDCACGKRVSDMKYHEAAIEVLKVAKRPLTAREITDRAIKRGLITPSGK